VLALLAAHHIFHISRIKVKICNHKILKTKLYADDQVILAKTEGEMQIAANTLHKTARKYNMTVSNTKTKSMPTCGKKLLRARTFIDDTIIEQVRDSMYLGNMIFEFKSDIAGKIHQYNKVNGTIERYFGKNVLTSTKLRLYNITSKAALKYGSEV
jgi:hypothetical protein